MSTHLLLPPTGALRQRMKLASANNYWYKVTSMQTGRQMNE